jgi:hypothetical protein
MRNRKRGSRESRRYALRRQSAAELAGFRGWRRRRSSSERPNCRRPGHQKARVSGVRGRGEGDLAEWLTDGGDAETRTETGGERNFGRPAARASRCCGAPVQGRRLGLRARRRRIRSRAAHFIGARRWLRRGKHAKNGGGGLPCPPWTLARQGPWWVPAGSRLGRKEWVGLSSGCKVGWVERKRAG